MHICTPGRNVWGKRGLHCMRGRVLAGRASSDSLRSGNGQQVKPLKLLFRICYMTWGIGWSEYISSWRNMSSPCKYLIKFVCFSAEQPAARYLTLILSFLMVYSVTRCLEKGWFLCVCVYTWFGNRTFITKSKGMVQKSEMDQWEFLLFLLDEVTLDIISDANRIITSSSSLPGTIIGVLLLAQSCAAPYT